MKKTILLCLLSTALFALSACQATDVVANYAIKSFDEITPVLADKILKSDKNVTIISPSDTERFVFGSEPKLSFSIAPFIAAGLDITKLPSEIIATDTEIVIAVQNSSVTNPTFEKLIRENRNSLEYHTDHDIYELLLGNGNAFRWAKDINSNERDIVFVLNPEPLIAAGLDPEKLDGWKFTKVKVMEDGKTIEVDKLLKVNNIK